MKHPLCVISRVLNRFAGRARRAVRSGRPGSIRESRPFRIIKLPALVLCLLLVFSFALAEEEDDLIIEEIIENVDLDAPGDGSVSWDFPLPLEDIDPEYVRLANKHPHYEGVCWQYIYSPSNPCNQVRYQRKVVGVPVS